MPLKLGERVELVRKTVSGIILMLLSVGILISVFNIQPVKASGTIYIRASGLVEGTTYVQTADNVTYVLVGNLGDSLVVERDNVVIDGNGYALQGTHRSRNSKGIDLSGRTNVTVENIGITDFDYGIWLSYSSNNSILGNTVANNNHGVCLVIPQTTDLRIIS